MTSYTAGGVMRSIVIDGETFTVDEMADAMARNCDSRNVLELCDAIQNLFDGEGLADLCVVVAVMLALVAKAHDDDPGFWACCMAELSVRKLSREMA